MASYGQQAKTGFLWGILGRGSTTVVAMGATVILARLLTPHDFGVAAAATFFIQIAQRLTNMGFNTALMRLPDLREEHSSTVFGVNLLFGLVGGLALTVSASALGEFHRSAEAASAIPIAGLTFAIGCLGTVPSALLNRQLRFRVLVAIETLYGWLISGVSLLLAWWGFGYWSLIYSLLVGAVVDAILKFAVSGWVPRPRVSLEAFRELWSFGAGLHLKRLLDSLALNIDNLVVGRMLGISMLGMYDKAFTSVNRAVAMVSAAGSGVSISVLGRIQHDDQRFRSAFRNVTLGIALIAYPTFAVLAALAVPLFVVTFGPQWTDAIGPFQFLCAAGMLRIYSSYVSAAIQAKGQVWGEVWRQLVYLVLMVAGVAWGSRWGLVGAAAGVLGASAVMTILICDLLRRVTSIGWSDIVEPQWAGVCCALGSVAVVLAARSVLWVLVWSPSVATELLIELAAAGAFTTGFLLFCPFRDARRLVRETLVEVAPWVGRRFRLRPL